MTISGSGIYAGSNSLADSSGNTIELFTYSTATFATSTYPVGVVSVTGILMEYNGLKEIIIRDENDVQ